MDEETKPKASRVPDERGLTPNQRAIADALCVCRTQSEAAAQVGVHPEYVGQLLRNPTKCQAMMDYIRGTKGKLALARSFAVQAEMLLGAEPETKRKTAKDVQDFYVRTRPADERPIGELTLKDLILGLKDGQPEDDEVEEE